MKIGKRAYYYDIKQSSDYCHVWIRQCSVVSFDEIRACVLIPTWFCSNAKIMLVKDLYESPQAVVEKIMNHFKQFPPIPNFCLEFKGVKNEV